MGFWQEKQIIFLYQNIIYMLFYVLKYKNIYFYIGVYSMTNQLDKIHLLLETMKQYAAVPITKRADLIKQLTFMMGTIYTNTSNKSDRLPYYFKIASICQTNHIDYVNAVLIPSGNLIAKTTLSDVTQQQAFIDQWVSDYQEVASITKKKQH
jgi:hypothetical protein